MCFCSCSSRWRFLLLFLKRQSHWQEDIFLTFPLAYKKNQHQNSLLISGLFQKDYETIIIYHISIMKPLVDEFVSNEHTIMNSFHTKLEIIEIEYHEYPDKLFLHLLHPVIGALVLYVCGLFPFSLLCW